MPAYDYKCTMCRHVFEVVRKPHDESPIACPSCASDGKRVFTPVGVVFKGSGFHNTDYRTTSTCDTPSSTSDTAETKTATPSETAPAKRACETPCAKAGPASKSTPCAAAT